jgi:Zn-dependent M28 family amino/carboxypeptidase
VDVAGANDNASGAAVTAVLASECAARPLRSTRLVLLITGSEEANVIGSRAFLDAHDTSGWLFLNFDGVGAAASLHHLGRERAGLRGWGPDAGLRAVAERVAGSRPDLALSGTDRSSGLPYDSTPILARGGRAITLSVQNGSIPNYHSPTDTAERIDPEVLDRALEAGWEMIAAIDRGEADP